MYHITIRIRFEPVFGSALFLMLTLFWGLAASSAAAEPHVLRASGRTLIEAEKYSGASTKHPRTESSAWCSGQANLAYFRRDKWFELKLEVPRMLNYSISLRAASPAGTQIEMQRITDTGTTSLATIDVPRADSWVAYTDTDNVIVSLPAGTCTLRFLNHLEDANVDYVTFLAGSEKDVITFEPPDSVGSAGGPDRNPLKGFCSAFQREHDDFATVGFQAIEWGLFEPTDDHFDWSYVETILDREGTRGRHFILQFVVDVDDPQLSEPKGKSHYRGPDWLLERVGENRGPARPEQSNSRITRATKYDDPVFIEEATEAVKTLLEHYRDDPRAFVFQAGVLGFKGQWNTNPMGAWGPTQFTKSETLNAYLANLGLDGLMQIRYPLDPVNKPQRGLGYYSSNSAPTTQGYEFGKRITDRQLSNNGPISGEWPQRVDQQYWEKFFQSDEGLFFIEQSRFTTMILPESLEIQKMLPSWTQDEILMNMHRRMGYNFQVKSVRHLVAVDDSKLTHLEVELKNVGIAPFYKKWNVQLAILNAETFEPFEILAMDTDLRNLKPNEAVTFTCTSSKKLDPSEDYKIGLRILQPGADDFKNAPWKLNPRNAYVVLANQVQVIDGRWADPPDREEKWNLVGGWNILDTLQRLEPEESQGIDTKFFPFQGSFRP
ncbi:MAG: DUF4832 domain-containing protein [Pirellulaceae bacterium]|nr:DUF4832 domain-containing protein [Pirellulaceae bacterium]